jgi:hypothetical protein
MSYTKTVWVDEILAGAETYNVSGTGAGVTIALDQTVTTPGTEMTAARMNQIEEALYLSLNKGADIASATALTLGSDGNYFDVTGTTTITSISTFGIGRVVRLHFDGILTLTHHATDLVLPGGANITTAAGDEFTFVEYATGDWRCVAYALASGEAIIGGSSSPLTTKGDLYGYSTADARFPVGANGQTIIADSSQSLGVKWGSTPTAKVKMTSNQAIANSTLTILNWNAEDWDTDSFHDNSTNNSRLTIPEDGKYLVIENIVFESSSSGVRQIGILVNGTEVWASIFSNNGARQDQTFTFFPLDLSSGDYVEARVWHDAGSSIDIEYLLSRFSIFKISV